MRTRIQLGGNTALCAAFLAIIPIFGAFGQTVIDLQTQAHNVDFTAEPWTRPIKTGTALPTSCSAGDFFFNTSSVAGQNLYGCVATNTWTLLGGPAGLSDPGANGLVRRTALNTTTAVAAPAGALVGTTDVQTLTNKSIDASEINSGTLPASRMPAFSGDITTAGGATAATLAAVNSNPGTYGDSTHSIQVAVDTKGRVTGITQMASATISQIMAGTFASLPGSCTAGGLYFATDRPTGQQIFTCSASNTWTPILSLGPSGALVFTTGALDINTLLIPLLAANNAFTGVNTGLFDSRVNVVPFSATPNFDLALGDQVISLSADIASSTLSHLSPGRLVSFKVCQDATGGHAFAWPANLHGGIAIGGNASTCSTQSFKSYDGSTLWAQSTGVINIP